MPWERVVTEQHGCVFSYTDWRDPLPRVPPDILNSIIYLYPDLDSAETGAEIGGSGCLVSMKSEKPGRRHVYALTNAHVIEDGCTIVRVNLKYPSGNARTFSLGFD